jgi:DNA invertase Pin-like site-specific DNA recombinase
VKTLAYLRVSTGSQDVAKQKFAILDYAQQQGISLPDRRWKNGHWFRSIPNAWDGEDFCQG